MKTSPATCYHYYAFDAALLLETCLDHLQNVVELDTRGSHTILYHVKEALVTTERLLQEYFVHILHKEIVESGSSEDLTKLEDGVRTKELPSLATCAKELRKLMDEQRSNNQGRSSSRHSKAANHDTSPSRSVTDTLLFRLIVALQLCLVRIDDAHFVIAGFRRGSGDNNDVKESLQRRCKRKWIFRIGFCGGVLGVTGFMLGRERERGSRLELKEQLQTLAKVGTASVLCFQLASQWQSSWMESKLIKSAAEIEDWQQQWILVEDAGSRIHYQDNVASESSQDSDDDKSKRLIEYAKKNTPNPSSSSSFWISQGELRFIIVRKALETYYSLTAGDDSDNNTEQQNLTTHVYDLMQHSWGLVSRPGFKNFSLKASRLLRGASVADRIEIAGVPCFVVSRHPCPELAAAIQCYKRKDRRRLPLQLSTIDENESTPSSPSAIPKKLFAGTNDRYRQQDVIFHCTGGGFVAHMIAFDLLYLLEWSASTGAVIICPEFDLLPQSPFPAALKQVTRVYKNLVSGDAISALGFEVNSIAITGESTGGNLAAALVTLCLSGDLSNNLDQHRKDGTPVSSPKSASDSEDDYSFPGSVGSLSESDDQAESRQGEDVRMPDALMLSCPVLSMSLELSHSRVVGTDDPVLPSQVLNAISDAYLPESPGVNKTHPLASPMYAADSILSRFPPTLLFASNKDPMLDDSIAFSHRLRSLGVESEIRAVQNMPHAFWGLELAGFPEAKQVHKEAKEWLAEKLRQGRVRVSQSSKVS